MVRPALESQANVQRRSVMKASSTSVLALAFALKLSAQTNTPKITGPFTHDNLTVFLIHGSNKTAKNLLTLEEAIDQRKVIVYETRDVNELAIENVSNEDVFIESGDIVKGGAQDRTLKDDLILPSKSGKVGISSFCVEHGRWTQRGGESERTFDSANQALATKQLKMAVKLRANQQEVWNQVAAAQASLSSAMNISARSAAAPTSLPMTMEAPAVRRSIDGYIQELAGVTNGKDDVIGYAFLIDGKLNSADIYGSHQLFAGLWMKLLRASAVEAVSEYQAGKKFAPGTVADVRAMLADADSAQPAVRDLTARTQLVTKETAQTVMFETRDRAQNGAWIHRNYMTR
jgi:hypothetical protein